MAKVDEVALGLSVPQSCSIYADHGEFGNIYI